VVYTVKQLADLANVSPRTLHYYDEIGLLKPAAYGSNGYRYYGREALLKLQQILFFRELGFSLDQIKMITGRPEFDLLHALEVHRKALQERAVRLASLIQTVDRTILYMKGEADMSESQLFEGFSEDQQQEYIERARERWGETVSESARKWNSYTQEQKAQIMAEGQAIYTDALAYLGDDPARPEVQQIIARWHQHMRNFYEPTPEIMLGLGQAYADDPEFAAFFKRLHPDLPDFLRRAITHYCQNLQAAAHSPAVYRRD
jgi:MerR family transcriptional regulator, thiopeptide resistance regulator